MGKRDLNYFYPYRPEGPAENQLTRAALTFMRLVPLAHGEFLRRADRGRSLSDLPQASDSAQKMELALVEFDTQTSQLHPTLERAISSGTFEGEGPRVISVFLTPERADLTLQVRESDRRAIFDGVIRYGNDLIIVIESKLDEGVDPKQSEEIPLGPLAGHCRLDEVGVLVRWHELLAAWQDLSEAGVLAYTDQRLLENFFDFAKESFGRLLPFNTLGRAEGNEERVSLRVQNILEAATGMSASREDHGWKVVGNWWTFERFHLQIQRDLTHGPRLVLSAWPGYKSQEARNLYGEQGLSKSIAALYGRTIGSAHFDVYPLFSISNYVPRAYQGFDSEFDTGEYIEFWGGHTGEIRRRSAEELEPLFDWLAKTRLADRDRDWPTYDSTFVSRRLSQVDLHPALEVDATWSLDEAIALDSQHLLIGEVNAAANAVLERLGEERLEPANAGESPR